MNGPKLTTTILIAPLIAGALAVLGGCDRLDDVVRDHLSGGAPRGDMGGAGGASPAPGCNRPPETPPQRCGVEDLGGGVVCSICYDQTGAAVSRECRTPSDTPGPIATCDERTDPATGVSCRICFDAAGVLVHDGCNPPPPRPDPAPTRCERVVDESGLVCSICYDASGAAVSRTCEQ
jgi:hypothetical protein